MGRDVQVAHFYMRNKLLVMPRVPSLTDFTFPLTSSFSGLQVSKLPLPAHLGLSEQYPTADELLSLSDIWIDDAEEMLKAADWSRKAQIRTLQTIILLNAYQSLTELADPAGATWNAAAIRIAQLLGFHELSESTTK